MTYPLKQLQTYLKDHQISLAFLDDPATVAYFTGYLSEPHERILALIATQEDSLLFTPALEQKEAEKVALTDRVIGYHDEEDPWQLILDWSHSVHLSNPLKMAIDKETLTVSRQESLYKRFSPETFIHLGTFINELRQIKSPSEINRMKKAGELADLAVQIGMDSLKVGISEQEVVAKIEFEMKKRGVSDMSFPTMVLFGDHAASPHGEPGSRQLKADEMVLFDLGVIYEGYASDMTRTIAFGSVSDEIKAIYQIVLDAQLTAENKAHVGMLAKDLDLAARQIIVDKGYGSYFNHRLGHGIGQTAHEFPSLHSENDQALLEGMCFSIEPGIYIENHVGIRIEDCYVLTEEGAQPLTTTSKEWTEIPVN